MTQMFFYRFITIVAVSLALIGCAPKAEMEAAIPAVSPAQISEAVTRADALFKERSDIAKAREGVKALAAVRNPDQRNFEVEWKFAMYSYFLGKQTTDTKDRDKLFDDGEQAGRIAMRMQPEKPDGYFWYAANLGEKAKISPVTVGAKSVDDIKGAMNKVIELDPKYQNASAFDALAQVELQTAGILGGKPEKAVELLLKGIALEDDNTYLVLHLAEAYLATGKKAEAKQQLDKLLKMKANPAFQTEYDETMAKGKKLLETKF